MESNAVQLDSAEPRPASDTRPSSSGAKGIAVVLALCLATCFGLLAALTVHGHYFNWEDEQFTLNPALGTRPDFNPANDYFTMSVDGCADTFRFSLEESSDVIVVGVEKKSKQFQELCASTYTETFELAEPIGTRQIIEKSTGRVLNQ